MIRNKKSSSKFSFKKFLIYGFMLGLFTLSVATILIRVFSLDSDKLISNGIKLDNMFKTSQDLTPKEYTDVIEKEIPRASEIRDMSNELSIASSRLEDLNKEFGTIGDVRILNYLGKYKIVFNVTLADPAGVDVIKFRQYCLDNLYSLFELNSELFRIQVNLLDGTDVKEKLYLQKGIQDYILDQITYDTNKYEIKDPPKNYMPSIENIQVKDQSFNQSDSVDKYIIHINSQYSPNGIDDVIDFVDGLFLNINSHSKKPTYLQVYNSNTEYTDGRTNAELVFSGLIIPDSKVFKDFYTNNKYFEDISRAEYYLCNEWLTARYSNHLQQVVDTLM